MNRTYVTAATSRILRPKEAQIGDRLPYVNHVDDVTLSTRDGLLVQVLKLNGFPFETMDDEELNYRKQIRETLLRGAASSRLALYHHVIRRVVDAQLVGCADDDFCRRLNEAWHAKLAAGRLYSNELFLTFVSRPLQGTAGFVERFFRSSRVHASRARELRELHATREAFAATLAPYGARTLTAYKNNGLRYSEPCSFLYALLNGDMRSVLLPENDIGQTLPDRRLSFGLDAIEIGPGAGTPKRFAAMVSIKDYPARSMPGMLDNVLRLPFELTLSESFSFVDRQTTLNRMNLALRRLQAADDSAFSLRDELSAARDQVGSGRATYGEHHLSILVKSGDLQELDVAVAEVQSALAEVGVIAVREDVNMEPAFWAQFPGNFKYVARKALISNANFASLASFHNHAAGQATGNHWGDAVALFETTAHGPYYFNFHNGDLGNFTVIGPSGAGKTVLLAFLIAQARKFRPRVIYFDKDRGAEIFIRAVGGRYDVLRPGLPTGLNPLLLADTPSNRNFLVDWLCRLLTSSGDVMNSDDRLVIADAVAANFEQTPRHRRLRYLRELFVGMRRPTAGDLAARLSAWCEDGEYAWLFDNENDKVDFATDVFGFDMTRMLDTPATRTPAMMYLFHCIEQSLDGTPTIIVVDEGWKALDDDVFVLRLKEWEKTIRKRNSIVGFCTQSPSDALESRIASAIVEQAATHIFLPNPRAKPADYIAGFGLTEHEFQLVRSLPDTSRCFLVKQADHSTVVRLDLAQMKNELKILAGTESSVRHLDAIRDEIGDIPSQWLPVFLKRTASVGGRQ